MDVRLSISERWFVSEDTRPGMAWNRHIMRDDNTAVCFMAHSGGRDPRRDAAQAKLIAQAPTMLALLCELIDIEGPCPGNAEWAGKVRAVIAAATGGRA